jgi:hypothetical protein
MLLGHRYYDPSTGRFLTRDPIKDGRNWYSYGGGLVAPTHGADPDGLLPILLVPLLIKGGGKGLIGGLFGRGVIQGGLRGLPGAGIGGRTMPLPIIPPGPMPTPMPRPMPSPAPQPRTAPTENRQERKEIEREMKKRGVPLHLYPKIREDIHDEKEGTPGRRRNLPWQTIIDIIESHRPRGT